MQWSPALKIGTAWRVESGTQGVGVGGAKRVGEGRSEGCFVFTSWLIGAFDSFSK